MTRRLFHRCNAIGDDRNEIDAIRLFPYGTLQQRGVQLANFGRQPAGRPDAMPGYRLEVLTVRAAEVVTVSGTAEQPWRLPREPRRRDPGHGLYTAPELDAADRYEVADYTCVLVVLGSGTRAWVYVGTAGG